MEDINITYLPGDILPEYRGDRVLFILANGTQEPNFELGSLDTILRGELGPDNAIRTYLGVSPQTQEILFNRYSAGNCPDAFTLDKQIIIDSRAQLRYEQVCGLLGRQRIAVQEIMISDM